MEYKQTINTSSWEDHCDHIRETLKKYGSRLPPDVYALYERSISDRNNWARGRISEMQWLLDTNRDGIADETIDHMEQFIATETERMKRDAPETASAELFDSLA